MINRFFKWLRNRGAAAPTESTACASEPAKTAPTKDEARTARASMELLSQSAQLTLARLGQMKRRPISDSTTQRTQDSKSSGSPRNSYAGIKTRLQNTEAATDPMTAGADPAARITNSKLQSLSAKDERTTSSTNRKLQELLEMGCENSANGK